MLSNNYYTIELFEENRSSFSVVTYFFDFFRFLAFFPCGFVRLHMQRMGYLMVSLRSCIKTMAESGFSPEWVVEEYLRWYQIAFYVFLKRLHACMAVFYNYPFFHHAKV